VSAPADLAPRLADRVIDRRGSFTSRAVIRMLCRHVADMAREMCGPDVTLEDAETVLDDALAMIKQRRDR